MKRRMRLFMTPLQPLRDQLLAHVLGAGEAVDLLLTALLAQGHTLVTGPPGIGKTTLAHTLARSLDGSFRRIQFTPDLLPSDILGYNLYRPQDGDFEFISGPVFANFLLADEINRASPRTQSALLEAMSEQQVTVDGATRDLPETFLVVATQNDTSATGTFPLPEPQLDRFLLSIPMGLPDDQTQLAVLRHHSTQNGTAKAASPVLDLATLATLQGEVTQLPVSENLQRYLLTLCQQVRRAVGQDHTISTRATLALQRAAQAAALLDGQQAVHPDHVQKVFPHVLRHRLSLEETPDPDGLLRQTLDQTPVP